MIFAWTGWEEAIALKLAFGMHTHRYSEGCRIVCVLREFRIDESESMES
jgi:hypothetical protein